MKRTFVGIGILLLLAGSLISFQATQGVNYDTVEVSKWDLHSKVLAPFGEDQDSTFYGRLMHREWWFQLNVSSSNTIALLISIVQHNPEQKVPISGWPKTGTDFEQKVLARNTGTYMIDIQNNNPLSVNLDGTILAYRPEPYYYNVYPYVLPGFLLILAGTSALIFGIFKKPRKLQSKSKTTKTTK